MCIHNIYIYIYKLSVFDSDDTKKSLMFIVVPQVEQVPKVQKKKKLKEMLDVIRTLLEHYLIAVDCYGHPKKYAQKCFL